MKTSKLIQAILLVGALSMVACAKKDSSFKSRYTKNAMGASAIDPANNQIAAETADAAGYQLDIVGIKGEKYSDGKLKITSQIMVNNSVQEIYTVHSTSGQVVTGQITLNGLNLTIQAHCADSNCEPYYISVAGYKGTTEIIQEGVKKSFTNNEYSRYQWFKAGSFMKFWGGSYSDTSGLIGYLNSK